MWCFKGDTHEGKQKQKQKQKPIALLCLWLLRYFHPVLVPHVGDREMDLPSFEEIGFLPCPLLPILVGHL